MTLFTHRNPEMQLDKEHTALVLVDMQNEFLSENGGYYQMIAERWDSENVHDHLEELLVCAKSSDIPVVHSPHYFYPTDGQWLAPAGAMADYLGGIGFVLRKDPLSLKDSRDRELISRNASASTFKTVRPPIRHRTSTTQAKPTT